MQREREREKERQTEIRQTKYVTERESGGDREREGQTDRQTETEIALNVFVSLSNFNRTATEDDEQVEIFCGEPLRQILLRMRQEVESRHRNRGNKSDRTTAATDRGQAKNSTYPYSAHMGSLSSNLGKA